jgi:hypothetical protein
MELGPLDSVGGNEKLEAAMNKELLAELNDLVEQAQRILREYLRPDTPLSPKDVISALLGVLDGPQQREVQSKVREALGRPALFDVQRH